MRSNVGLLKIFFRKAKEIQRINMLMKDREHNLHLSINHYFFCPGRKIMIHKYHIGKPNFQCITVTFKISDNKMWLLICSCNMMLLEIKNIQFFLLITVKRVT